MPSLSSRWQINFHKTHSLNEGDFQKLAVKTDSEMTDKYLHSSSAVDESESRGMSESRSCQRQEPERPAIMTQNHQLHNMLYNSKEFIRQYWHRWIFQFNLTAGFLKGLMGVSSTISTFNPLNVFLNLFIINNILLLTCLVCSVFVVCIMHV